MHTESASARRRVHTFSDEDRLDAVMVRLGLDNSDLAKYAGVHRNTVAKWRKPNAKIPKIVLLHLELLADLKRATDF